MKSGSSNDIGKEPLFAFGAMITYGMTIAYGMTM
jgi:hypothetical protein